MNVVITDVALLVQKEYENAAKSHGEKYNSLHEAYSVIKEELEEVCEDINLVVTRLEEDFWQCARNDNDENGVRVAHTICQAAINAACECIQVAAMAHKATLGYNGGAANE